MFNNNKNITVGRDINVTVTNSNIENISTNELKEEKANSQMILNKEFARKIKMALAYIMLALFVFVLLFFGLPLLIDQNNADNIVSVFLVRITSDREILILLSGLSSVVTIINPLFKLFEKNEIEKRHTERIVFINTELKEREYLNKH